MKNQSWVRVGLILLVVKCVTPCGATYFLDDFNGASLDTNVNWNVVNGRTLARSQLINMPTTSNSVATLRFDTYNAGHPGTLMAGSEMYSKQLFARGTGLEFETRARMVGPIASGLVTAFFTYTDRIDTNTGHLVNDEIDFEFLSRQINNPPQAGGDSVVVTSWQNFDNDVPNGTPAHYQSANPHVAGLDLTQFNTFTIRWLPDRTEWLIDGVLIHSSTNALPDEPMPIRLNFWAPASSWSAAYDASLQPVSSSAANSSYFYQIDYVRVSSIPEAGVVGMVLAGLLVLRKRAAIPFSPSSPETRRESGPRARE